MSLASLIRMSGSCWSVFQVVRASLPAQSKLCGQGRPHYRFFQFSAVRHLLWHVKVYSWCDAASNLSVRQDGELRMIQENLKQRLEILRGTLRRAVALDGIGRLVVVLCSCIVAGI